ncbi:MAG: hypothetical protein IAE83_05135 [Anaerolinea sp.]|nr:hypothetical protein [Anaerolinea sp.]MCC6973558.1 hypothetical protein [Anaerolineae bacterium]
MPPTLSAAPAAILIPLGTAFVMPLIGRFVRHFRPALCIASLLCSGVVLLSLGDPVLKGQTLVYWMSSWAPRDGLAIGISLSVDAWGWLIALITVIVGLASVIYAAGYLRGETGHETYYVLVMLLITGLIGFALSGDLFNQFVWLEVFSVAAFALTAFHPEHAESIEAAFKYLITNSIAAFFVAIGLTLLYLNTGALNLAHVARDFKPTPGGMIGVGLLVGGYATKAALVPWHFWLPDAHAAAPTPVSALFSGALIKIGLYAVARCVFTLVPPGHNDLLRTALIGVGTASIFVGGVQMLHQKQIKRILAYSSVAQMGYLIIGVGLGSPGALAGAALHALHHALVKSALFMGTGAVVRQTDAHTLDECGGLARLMPITFVLVSGGTAALAGMPFSSGYLGKSLITEAAKESGMDWLSLVVVGAGIFTLAGMLRLIWRVFFGEHRTTGAGGAHEAPLIMLMPIAALMIGSLLIGFSAEGMTKNLGAWAAHALQNRDAYIGQVMEGTVPPESLSAPEIHPPEPGDISHWGSSILILVGGVGMAYLSLRKPFSAGTLPYTLIYQARRISLALRLWHTGIVTDYALWNSVGTALLIVPLMIQR